MFDFFESGNGRILLDLCEIGLTGIAIVDYLSWTDRYSIDPFRHSTEWSDVSTFVNIGDSPPPFCLAISPPSRFPNLKPSR